MKRPRMRQPIKCPWSKVGRACMSISSWLLRMDLHQMYGASPESPRNWTGSRRRRPSSYPPHKLFQMDQALCSTLARGLYLSPSWMAQLICRLSDTNIPQPNNNSSMWRQLERLGISLIVLMARKLSNCDSEGYSRATKARLPPLQW